jgi:hypothetical protein
MPSTVAVVLTVLALGDVIFCEIVFRQMHPKQVQYCHKHFNEDFCQCGYAF